MLVVPPSRRLWKNVPTPDGYVGGFDGWVESASVNESLTLADAGIDTSAETLELCGTFPGLGRFVVWGCRGERHELTSDDGSVRTCLMCDGAVPVGRSKGELAQVIAWACGPSVDERAVTVAIWSTWGRRYWERMLADVSDLVFGREGDGLSRAAMVATRLDMDAVELLRLAHLLCPSTVASRMRAALPALMRRGDMGAALMSRIVRVAEAAESPSGAWPDFPASFGSAPLLAVDASLLVTQRPESFLDCMWGEGASEMGDFARLLFDVVPVDGEDDVEACVLRADLLRQMALSSSTVVDDDVLYASVVDAGRAVQVDRGGITSTEALRAEERIAHMCNEVVRYDVDDLFVSSDVALTDEQEDALRVILSSSTSVLVGCALTGRLGVIDACADVLSHEGQDVFVLTAMVAQASVARLSLTHVADDHVMTLAQAMSHVGVISVASMVVLLGAETADVSQVAFFANSSTDVRHRVLVGDDLGLAPFGVGDPFCDVVASGLVPVARLTYRSGVAPGRVRDLSHVIGYIDDGDVDGLLDVLGNRFVECDTDFVKSAVIAHTSGDWDVDGSILVCPYRSKREVDRLNVAIRDAVNPRVDDGVGGVGMVVCRANGDELRVGDIVRRVSRDGCVCVSSVGATVRREVSVGDMGRVEDVVVVDGVTWVRVRLSGADDVFAMDRADVAIGSWTLGWASTVHAMAGTFECVTLVVPPGRDTGVGHPFVDASLLHAAFSRSRSDVVLVADRDDVALALAWRGHGRRSNLQRLLSE